MDNGSYLNDILASNSNLINNPYLQSYSSNASQHQHVYNNGNSSDNHNHNNEYNTNECMHPSNQWIINLFESKKESVEGTSKQWAYIKAIKSIKQCPTEITNQQQALSVDGIGKAFAALIKQKYKSRHLYSSSESIKTAQIQQPQPPQSTEPKKKENKKPRKAANKKPYIPRMGSGGYALLIHLYKSYIEDGVQGISKQQLIRDAQQYTNASFTEGKGPYKYTAWSNMARLIECNYVQKITKRRATFYLTEPGMVIAAKLYAKMMGLPTESDEEKTDHSLFNDSALITETDSKYKFKCQYCDKLYAREGSYKKHIETKHPNGSNAKPRPQLLAEYQSDHNTNNPKKFSVFCMHFL